MPPPDGGWTPSYEGDMCIGGHPPQSVHTNPDGTEECGRCGRAIDRTVCGCDDPGHEYLSRSFCPIVMQRDKMTIARRQRAERRNPKCRVYWGSHGCQLPRGHDPKVEPHACDCCTCPDHERDHEGRGCVALPPYYGGDGQTVFYGEDA